MSKTILFNLFRGNQRSNLDQITFDGPFDDEPTAAYHAWGGLRCWSYVVTVEITNPLAPLFRGETKPRMIDLSDEIVKLEHRYSCAG